MTTAAYIRVSTKAQDHASQRDAIERALPRGTSPDAVEWYGEKMSAKTSDRPVLNRLLQDARMGKVTELYLFKLDRLTRTGVADTFRVVAELRKAGVTVHCIADNLTIKPVDDIVSETMIFALSLAARLERTAINDRISAARTRMEKAGQAWGRPERMTPELVERARAMRAEGRSVRDIAVALKIPRATVGRAVKGDVAA